MLSFHIVPLRERIGDVPLLANYFIGEINRRGERESKIISPECMRILEQHTWPGNARELQNVILRAYYCSGKNDVILPEHLPDDLLHPLSNTRTPQPKQYSGEDTAQKEKSSKRFLNATEIQKRLANNLESAVLRCIDI